MSDIEFKFGIKSIKNGESTKLCSILNITPDSFSDGGKYFDLENAVKRAKELVSKGAYMLDIGGESTRPGSKLISVEEAIERIVPIIKAIKSEMDVVISVDTWKSEVAKAAIDAGADIINDITGLLGDEKMVDVIAHSNVGYIMMFNPVIIRPEHEGSKIFPKFGKNAFITDKDLEYFQSLDILDMMEECFNKTLSSPSSSATRFPSATVRTITPKFFGLILISNCLRRARSSLDLIFCDTETLSLKGISTRYLPANEISEVRRGPLVEIGSLTICTTTSCPTLSVLATVPSFSRSGSMVALVICGSFFLSLKVCFTYFSNELN